MSSDAVSWLHEQKELLALRKQLASLSSISLELLSFLCGSLDGLDRWVSATTELIGDSWSLFLCTDASELSLFDYCSFVGSLCKNRLWKHLLTAICLDSKDLPVSLYR